jgi:DNA-binding NarL/FixJ family response regulator
MGRPLVSFEISTVDQEQLKTWSRRPKTAQALAMRSRIVLLAAEGNSNSQIAQIVLTSKQTVGKWRQRYIERMSRA